MGLSYKSSGDVAGDEAEVGDLVRHQEHFGATGTRTRTGIVRDIEQEAGVCRVLSTAVHERTSNAPNPAAVVAFAEVDDRWILASELTKIA